MDRDKLKETVKALLDRGIGLSEIQKILFDEYGENITFLDLKLLSSELEDVDWRQFNPEEEAGEAAATPEDPEVIPPSGGPGGTHVELSKIARPGAVLSGSAKFASGASADWVVDSFGRLGFENKVGEPTKEDLEDFQQELQKLVQDGGM